MRLTDVAAPLTLIVDEGKKKSNSSFGQWLFRDRKRYNGRYAASCQEPLLQIADLDFVFDHCANSQQLRDACRQALYRDRNVTA